MSLKDFGSLDGNRSARKRGEHDEMAQEMCGGVLPAFTAVTLHRR
jgi:hypothetical protein